MVSRIRSVLRDLKQRHVLQTAVERGWVQPSTTRLDPLLAPLRTEHRFGAILSAMDQRVAAMQARVLEEDL